MGSLKVVLLALAVPLLTACSAPASLAPTAVVNEATSAPATMARMAESPAPTTAAPTQTKPPQTATSKPAVTTAPTAVAAVPIATPPPTTPTASGSGVQVIRQDIVIVSTPTSTDISEGPVSGEVQSQGSLTIKAEIQIGNVDGVNFGSTDVPMPSGAVPYDNTRLPKVGDVVKHPSGLVVQVLGSKTVPWDADNEFVLVDVVVGNTGKERELVATDPCMEIISGDGHWYSGSEFAFYWSGSGDENLPAKKAREMQQAMVKGGATSYYSAALDPGQAARGTAIIPVPKSARQLAFGFQPYKAATYLFFGSEESPTVLVPLGLRGDFPTIPANVAPLKAGTTYTVGQAFKAPKRGIALQVGAAWQQLEAMGDRTLKPNEQLAVVELAASASNGAKPLSPSELQLVDGSGKKFELQPLTVDWFTMPLGQYNQRDGLIAGSVTWPRP